MGVYDEMDEARKQKVVDIKPETREFLLKLKALFIEHGAELRGCGCCGSPSIDFPGKDCPGLDDITIVKGEMRVEQELYEDDR